MALRINCQMVVVLTSTRSLNIVLSEDKFGPPLTVSI